MRRLRALVPVLLLILLLGLCIAAGFVSQHRILRWGFSTLHNRYSFLIDHQEFLIRTSPPPKKEDAEAWVLLKRLRNDDVQWSATSYHGWNSEADGGMVGPYLTPVFKQDSIGSKLSKLSKTSDEPFLRALDSPQKFVAAHVLLAKRHSGWFVQWMSDSQPGMSLHRAQFNGVHFDPPKAPKVPLGSIGTVPIADRDIRVIPAQLPAIRAMWHDALDQTIISISIWWIVGGTMVLIVLQCKSALRRAERHRLRQCVHCGYDLRASTGVCPECGSPIPKNASTPSAV